MVKYNMRPKEQRFAILVMTPIVLAGVVLLVLGMVLNAETAGILVAFGRVLIFLGIFGALGLLVRYKARMRRG